MGIFDSLLGKPKQEEAPDAKNIPFSMASTLRPVRLRARAENSCELILHLKNISNSTQMCSILVELPKSLGFDTVGLHKTKELRLGSLEAGKERDVSITINANNQTPAGTYRLFVTAYSHYRDYSHVLNSIRKAVEIRAV